MSVCLSLYICLSVCLSVCPCLSVLFVSPFMWTGPSCSVATYFFQTFVTIFTLFGKFLVSRCLSISLILSILSILFSDSHQLKLVAQLDIWTLRPSEYTLFPLYNKHILFLLHKLGFVYPLCFTHNILSHWNL